MSRHDDAAPLAALLISLVAFLFCVLASTAYHWHSGITGPCAGLCALALLASGVWLNRAAGSGDGEDEEEGPE